MQVENKSELERLRTLLEILKKPLGVAEKKLPRKSAPYCQQNLFKQGCIITDGFGFAKDYCLAFSELKKCSESDCEHLVKNHEYLHITLLADRIVDAIKQALRTEQEKLTEEVESKRIKKGAQFEIEKYDEYREPDLYSCFICKYNWGRICCSYFSEKYPCNITGCPCIDKNIKYVKAIKQLQEAEQKLADFNARNKTG